VNYHDIPAAAAGEKRSRLEGGALTEEALDSSRAVLGPTGYGQLKGLQQYFSPPEAAALAWRVITGGASASGYAPFVLDPTAGNGALMAGWPPERRFGVEIDPDQAEAGDYAALRGDLQRLYPLMRLAGVRFPAVVCNPPFGLTWSDPASGRPVNSTALCLRFALGLLDERGQGLLIAGRDRYHREIEPLPEARGVWCTIDCDDLFDGTELPVTLAFFVQRANRRDGETQRLSAHRMAIAELAPRVIEWRGETCGQVSSFSHGDGEELREAFACVQREHDRRRSQRRTERRHDVELRAGRLRCHPSAFAKLALAERGLLRQVQGLNGKAVHYFALNLREWRALRRAAADGCLELEPSLPGAVERVVAQAAREACPMYPVKPQMRLGFVADLERLHCVKDDPELGFLCGEDYPLKTRTRVETEYGEKLVTTKAGEQELRDFRRERKLLEITVGPETFDESPAAIAYLIEHFDMPDPGDLASRYPNETARATGVLDGIAREHGFRFKPFQLEDLARLVVKGSGVLAHEQGLGKTLQAMAFAAAMPRYHGAQDCALFVIPQDLLPQWQREARKFFGRQLEPIATQADAKRVARELKRGGSGWYVTWYEALSLTGRKDEPLPRERVLRPGERRLGGGQGDGEEAPSPLYSDEFCPGCLADGHAGWRRGVCRRCGYVHKRLRVRTIASLLSVAFRRGTVCVDELSQIRGDDSLRSKAVRALRARHPLGATGTPISNYVNDCFWGLWWALGNASTRFPYDHDGKPGFERDFCVIETLYGSRERGEQRVQKRRKILPEVTNLSVLWRLLSQSIVRRRKEDTGEPLVERTYYPVRVPFGQRQRELHEKWLKDFERFFCQTHPDSPLVAAGVVHLFAAGLGQLPKLEYAATLPGADPDLDWTGIAASNWTPKTLKVLELCLERVAAGDKVLVGSCLIETGRFLAERLRERGVRAVHIVEEREGRAQTKNPRKRAAEVYEFVEGDAEVLCAGVQAVQLGHNLDAASAVVLSGLPWSFSALSQFEARVHRLTSTRPVSVYAVLTRGSLDERKWELLRKKGAASDLALDGQLVGEQEKPIDWNKVLREMRAAGVRASGDELDEQDLRALWERADGPYAPLAPPAAVVPLADRLARERADRTSESPAAEEGSGQLAFDLAA
jgi:hypothetical protein